MRLTSIKLAGFKSFVEPTTIKLPSNLIGVVGPNGCGKSNIIDAVRWVMGETSARQLRGESMSDVIFSGSSMRKPVATATVELMFDNGDGRAGGEYSSYNEISVRRQVSRDGQSAYFLNGSRCRRKDITDLFLGTGLGPRSYAIIEQGMISQIVEARPEDLRAFLEEAAGVSLYKERRRETENRIRHTRENLDRLNDLREEVTRQLGRLKRQANAAERYRKLKQRYREQEAGLNALRWRSATQQLDRHAGQLRETETRIEQAVAMQREAERTLESLREQQHKASQKTSGVQAELYEVAGEIARLEQSIEHQRDILKRQKKEHAEVEGQINELKQHLLMDRSQVKELTGRIAGLEPELEQARAGEEQARSAFEEVERLLGSAEQELQARHGHSGEVRQQAELLKMRIEHLDERMNQAGERLERMQGDDGRANEQLASERSQTASELEAVSGKLEQARAEQADQRQALTSLQQEISSQREQYDSRRATARELQGQLESLRVLNNDGDDQAEDSNWLEQQGLAQAATVLQAIDVQPRWQRAVELVLADWLMARVVERLAQREPPAGLGLVEQAGPAAEPGTLGGVVKHAGALTGMLNSVVCCDDLTAARARLDELQSHQTLITPEGIWLGPGRVRNAAGQGDAESGRLARQARIRELEQELDESREQIRELEIGLQERSEQAEQISGALERQRAEVDRLQAEHSRLSGIRAGQDNRLQALERQSQARAQEQSELRERQRQDEQALGQARRELQDALQQLERLDGQESEARANRDRLQAQREQLRQQYREARKLREELALKMESGRASLDSLKQAIQRMDSQIGQLQGRYVELSEALARGDRPVLEQQAERDRLLDRRLQVEKRLGEARGELEALEQQWREHDGKRQQAAGEAEQLRQRQSEQRVHQRELEIEVAGFAARVEELDGDLEALVAELGDDAESEARVEELTRLEEKIRRLEPINLAAIDEYQQESERKEYLDRQHADLSEALETLEQAIARIDRTTRTRYKDTFEQVNKNIAELFPRLFGGGHAHLEMVGDDWLTAGAAIMARPPGKRISRIHLLSGGEKALTAIAFVFSIFNLNPAPFCLLDEVDAPLDDANVGRFSELVREMSEQVQFLFVTHNKVTMEVAHQMLGVTMREAGISRLVSVDLDKAVALAAS